LLLAEEAVAEKEAMAEQMVLIGLAAVAQLEEA
jgi:hypothetical protein